MFRRATLVLMALAAGSFVFPSCTCGMEDTAASKADAARPKGKLPPLPRVGAPIRLRAPLSAAPTTAPSAP